MAFERGDIWWANLPDPNGSEPGFRRPVAVIQSDAFNRSNLRTVVVAAIYSNLRLAEHVGNVLISSADSGLSKDSVVNVSQIATVDGRVLTERVGALNSNIMDEIDEGLRLALAL